MTYEKLNNSRTYKSITLIVINNLKLKNKIILIPITILTFRVIKCLSLFYDLMIVFRRKIWFTLAPIHDLIEYFAQFLQVIIIINKKNDHFDKFSINNYRDLEKLYYKSFWLGVDVYHFITLLLYYPARIAIY